MASKDRRLAEEIAFHIEQQTAKNIRAGMAPAEARRAARVTFGGVQQVREATRDEMRGVWLRDFGRDLRIAFRGLARVPSFSITAILTIGLGIGAAAAMFTVVDGVLLRPLPYPDAGRIVQLFQIGEKGTRGANVSDPNFLDWQAQTGSFAAMAETAVYPQTVTGAGEPQSLRVAVVSQGFFDVLATRPTMGRGFRPDELQRSGAKVAIVGAGFWERWRGARPLAGDAIVIGGVQHAVVGVMPDGFDYPQQAVIWTPREQGRDSPSRTAHNFRVVARVKPGVDIEQASAELSRVSRVLKARYGTGTWMADAVALPLLDVISAGVRPALRLLFAASLLLLLVACTNVSNLLVARAVSRRREFAVQLALGASTGRVTRQWLAETLAVAACGAAIGLALATVAVRAFVALGPRSAPRLDQVSIDWTSIAFAGVIALVAAVVLSLLTAWGTRGAGIADALTDNSRTGSSSRRQMRGREALIVAQVALTMVLLAGAGLLARSFAHAMAVDPGFRLSDDFVLDTSIELPGDGAGPRRAAMQDLLLARVRALPGVTAAGLINAFPLGRGQFANGTFIEMSRVDEITKMEDFRIDAPQFASRTGDAEYRVASDGYFEAMDIPLLSGRLFDATDAPDRPHVAIISRSLAEKQWAGRDPLGRFIQFGNMDGDLTGLRVVGVVGDVRESSVEALPGPMIYVNARQRPTATSSFSVIAHGPAAGALGGPVRRIMRDVAPDSPYELTTVSAGLDRSVGTRRFNLSLIGAFAAAALGLAMLGVYGLVAYAVSQRSREMGIRVALGAEPASLVRMVLTHAARLTLVGSAVGLGLTLLASNAISGMLYGVTAVDPAVLMSVAATMLAAAMAASYLPARRILKQPPGLALRS
ncbi:MAG: ABC transporter permease [Vicinamibacteraceae bacterium]